MTSDGSRRVVSARLQCAVVPVRRTSIATADAPVWVRLLILDALGGVGSEDDSFKLPLLHSWISIRRRAPWRASAVF